MSDQVMSQADNEANDTQAVDVNKQESKLTPEVMAEEMRQARTEAARYRTERNEFANQIKELSKKADKGSELEKSLSELTGKLATLETQSNFYDKAHGAGVRNLKLAFFAAQQAGLVSEKGDCDFAKLKEEYPELFTNKPVPSGDGGEGAHSNNTAPTSMDERIRMRAGAR